MESNWELDHVGLLVFDLNKLLKYYQSLHLGWNMGPQPFAWGYTEGESSLMIWQTLNGDPVTRTFSSPWPKVNPFSDREFQIGSLQLECLPTSPSASHIWEWLESKGEGINHIAFKEPDQKGEVDKLVDEKGCQIMLGSGVDGRSGEPYFDTHKFGGVILSLRGTKDKWYKAWIAHNMEHPLVSDWRFRGMGIAVRELDKVVEYYQFLYIATFQPEVMLDSSSIADFKAYGKTPDTVVKARTRTAQVGPVAYEFTQPLEGEAIYKESLDRRGEGVNDFVFIVDDLDKETAKLVERGAPVIRSGKPQTGGAFAYFDTRKVGNIMVKLIQAE